MSMIAKLWRWVFSDGFAKDIDSVQRVVVRSCGFLPTIATVAALLARPGVVTAAAVALAICDAVTRRQALEQVANSAYLLEPPPPPAEVDGVVIDGEFI